MISFYFLFLYLLLVVCGLLRRFTPRNDKGNKRQYPSHRHCDYETVIARLCRRSENLVIETTTHNPHCHCEALKKAVAISFILGLSLREPKVRGNLSMGYNFIYSWDSFSFLFFLWWFCGLWIAATSAKSRNDEEWWVVICGGLPPFVRGEVAKQQGVEKKLKMKNWKLRYCLPFL